jgi:glucokinase
MAGRILLADLGGSTSRLALTGPDGRPQSIAVIANDTVTGTEAMIADYLDRTGAVPQAAVLAVAGPVGGNEIVLTNSPHRFRLDDLKTRFGLLRIRAINDFEAIAWALARLGPGDLRVIGPDVPVRDGPRVAFGPGTGLGVAALMPVAAGWLVVPSEGGHMSFGPALPDEHPVFARLYAAAGPISAEKVLSGPGLERLHLALHAGTTPLAAEAIVAAARNVDAAAIATLALFARLLGRYAGDLALMFNASGGVHLAGGVVRRIGALFDDDAFRAAFLSHPPHQRLLEGIRTALVTTDEPGLLGCAVLADRMG